MVVRKLRLYRMQAGLTLKECDKVTGISRNRINALETLTVKFKPKELKIFSELFGTTREELKKLIDMDVIRIVGNRCEYKVNKIELTVEEEAAALSSLREAHRLSYRNYIDNRVKRVREAYSKEISNNVQHKPFKCLNQACLLNSSWTKGCDGKTCMCDNPVVIRGIAPCLGKDKVQDKKENSKINNKNNNDLFIINRWVKGGN